MVEQGLGIDDLLKDKRDDILRLAAKYGASNLRVFGSVARGEARADSDIDLLVNFSPDYSLWDRIGLMQDLEDLLQRKVDVVLEKKPQSATPFPDSQGCCLIMKDQWEGL